ncbi:MAG: ABC transporter permease [Lactobacillales bacterium]|jgi:teichoic acid transport system permease protein|nr:ABC transporter permease [Lactobacillales bacterium]
MFKELGAFVKDMWHGRKLLLEFSYNDFKARYAGSMLGIAWAFVNPLVMVLTYWIVFSKVMRSGSTENFPFIVYLMTGMVSWFFFSDVFTTGTSVFREYSYLVKKVVFNVRILPTAKLLSNLLTHFFFIIVAFLICFAYKIFPTLQTLQLFYYLFALCVFLTGLTWITASIQPFFPDITQLIGVFMQALMWATPVLYSPMMFPETYRFILKINPLYYIVMGYRDSFLSRGWFWEHPALTIYFWVVTIILLLVGSAMFKRLKPHFSDVL